MVNSYTRKQYYFLAAILVVTSFLVTLGNLQIVKNYPSGYDFVAHWQGTRTLISDGINPYSEEAAAKIKSELAGLKFAETTDEYRFLAPLYAIFIYAPLTMTRNIPLACAIWMTILEGLLLASGLLILRSGIWKKSLFLSILLIIYVILSYPSTISILNGNLAVVSLAMIVFAVNSLRNHNDEAAGLILSISLVKPDAVWMIILFLLIWAIRVKRYRIVYWFLGTFVLLMGFSILLMPDWFIQYFREVYNYSFSNPVTGQVGFSLISLSDLVGRLTLGKWIILTIILISEWFFVKLPDQKRLYWLIGLTLSFSLWFGNRPPQEYLMFALPGLFLGFELFTERWKEKAEYAIVGIAILLFLVQWIISGYLTAGTVNKITFEILNILIPGITILLLYWSRWWVLHGMKLNGQNKNINF